MLVPEAVIYDMDGVIIDSEPVWRDVEIEVFGRYGLALTHEMCAKTMGRRTNEVVEFWMADRPLPVQQQAERELIDGVKSHVRGTSPMKGVVESLEFLRAHGIPIALASSSFY